MERLLEHVAAALGVSCRVEVAESPDLLTATCVGDELGRLVGRDGRTLDALELIAGAIVRQAHSAARVVVDADGYRDKRRAWLERLAAESATEAVTTGRRVELEPMSAGERKVIHARLEEHAGVVTSSEGTEPNRRVVVEPA